MHLSRNGPLVYIAPLVHIGPRWPTLVHIDQMLLLIESASYSTDISCSFYRELLAHGPTDKSPDMYRSNVCA